MVDTYAVTGSYSNIAQRIKERYRGLVDRVGLYQPWQPGLTDPRWPALVKPFNGWTKPFSAPQPGAPAPALQPLSAKVGHARMG